MTDAFLAERLSVAYQGSTWLTGRRTVHALREVDLRVARGAIVAVLGPNGSGKTTLLRVLAGLLTPNGGTARVLGETPGSRALRTALGYQPEGALPLPYLSATEFLDYYAAMLDLPRATAVRARDAMLERLDLQHAGHRQIRHFSTGMQRRLALAAALLPDPPALLLDEPTSGLDPMGSAAIMDLLRERAAAGTAVLMASHHLQEVEEICDEVLVLQGGEVRARGPLDRLLGTGDRNLIVRGLDDGGLQQVEQRIREVGGEVLGTSHARQHLFALFRRLGGGDRR